MLGRGKSVSTVFHKGTPSAKGFWTNSKVDVLDVDF